MAEKIPGWLERLLLPRLSSLEGDIKEFRGEVRGELKAINARLDSVEKGLENIKSRITLIQDVATLKAQVKELQQSFQRR